MSGFDRSAFRATKVEALKEQEEQVKELTGRDDSRIEYLKLEKGKNKVRLYPGHPGTRSFCYAKTVHFLELESKDKDGNPIKDDNGKVEIKRRPVFNAKVHGHFPEGSAANDIIDEYVQRVFKQAHEMFQDDNQRKQYLSTMTFWKTGITGKTKWVVYADLYDNNNIPQFGRLELPTTVKDKLNEIAANQEGDGMLQIDPFTDPDDGRVVFITYDPDEKDAKKKYTASIDFAKTTPLSDDQLGQMAEQDSLEKLFVNSYKNRDFNNAIEGLKRFDDKSTQTLRALGFDTGYNIFAQEDFLDVCEKTAELFPMTDDEEARQNGGAAQSNSFVDGPAATPKQAFKPTPTALEEMNLDQLADYIAKNNLDITILPDDAPEDVVLAIKDEQGVSQDDSAPAEATTRRSRGNRSANLD